MVPMRDLRSWWVDPKGWFSPEHCFWFEFKFGPASLCVFLSLLPLLLSSPPCGCSHIPALIILYRHWNSGCLILICNLQTVEINTFCPKEISLKCLKSQTVYQCRGASPFTYAQSLVIYPESWCWCKYKLNFFWVSHMGAKAQALEASSSDFPEYIHRKLDSEAQHLRLELVLLY